jgi:hypothetical protein
MISGQKVVDMVRVQVRFNGEGIWRAMTLPVTPQLGQTLAGKAKELKLGDQVQVVAGIPNVIDIKA